MARGGSGGKRGGSRGAGKSALGSSSKNAAGFAAGAQGSKTSFAQSGGIASTYGASKSGAGRAFGNKGGATSASKPLGSGRQNNGASYVVKGPGGDASLVRGGIRNPGAGHIPLAGGKGSAKNTPRALRPDAK